MSLVSNSKLGVFTLKSDNIENIIKNLIFSFSSSYDILGCLKISKSCFYLTATVLSHYIMLDYNPKQISGPMEVI